MGRTCVIYNPTAGRGRAGRLLNALPPELARGVELRPTAREGHAVELARGACDEGFAKVVAAGGDGTVHEVANGVLQSGRRDVVFGVWPVGSANDFAFTLGLSAWWRLREQNPPLETLAVDVGRITAAGRERFFVNCAGVGFNGWSASRRARRVARRPSAVRVGVPEGDGAALRHA
jgi:diacylglycerol kinase family enzyme